MRSAFAAVLVLGTALLGGAPHSYAATPLRLRADPDNLPFGTASAVAGQAGGPGLYVEIGQAVAGALGRPMETVWSLTYFGKRNLLTTLLAGQCGCAVVLPTVDDFMDPSEQRINLRLLRRHYGDDRENVFHTTVTNGRPNKGMPTWGGLIPDEDIAKSYAFLDTVQEP